MNLANILPELKLKLLDLFDDKSLFLLTKVCKELRKFVFANKELKLRYVEFNKLYLSAVRFIKINCTVNAPYRINIRIYIDNFIPIDQILSVSPDCKSIGYMVDKKYILYSIDYKKALNSIESIVKLRNYEFDLKNIDIDAGPYDLCYYTNIHGKPK